MKKVDHDFVYRIGKWTAATAVGTWAQIPGMVKLLLLFMLLDMLTGILSAFVQKSLCSQDGARGVAKKALILILVGTAHLASDQFHLGLDLGSAVSFAYMVNELVSIVENCAHAGIPIPGQLLDALAKFKPKRSKADG